MSESHDAEALKRPSVQLFRRQFGPVEQLEFHTEGDVLPRPMRVSAFRIGTTLVDTASANAAPHLVEALRENPPRRIILTHQHEDHIGGAKALRDAFGDIPVYAPRDHLALIANHPRVPAYRELVWGQPEPIGDLVAYGPGDVFDMGSVVFEAWLTPGHTPGHMALVSRSADTALALAGDLYIGSRPVSAWLESAADDMAASCRLVATAGPDLTLFPGHGPVRTDGRDALTRLADWLQEESEILLALAEERRTRDYGELAAARYGGNDSLAATSNGEFSHRNFVRSVLDPVHSLPASVA